MLLENYGNDHFEEENSDGIEELFFQDNSLNAFQFQALINWLRNSN